DGIRDLIVTGVQTCALPILSVVLVSSGSIALGRRLLKLSSGALRLEESQAAAAAGQVRLAEAYADMLAARSIVAAQVLLTFGDKIGRASCRERRWVAWG